MNEANKLQEKNVDRGERAKKLYRYICDIIRRIDAATASCDAMSDYFSTYLEVLRQKLRENCEKLFFLDPLNYGKKCLELLWRKVYYDTITLVKKEREIEPEYDVNLFTHIMCGIGNFQNFIAKIQIEMHVAIKGLDYLPISSDEQQQPIDTKSIDDDIVQFGRSSLHSCFLYLGDLCRYQTEIFQSDPSDAVRYYLQAANINLNSGMPYNQLGNLFLDHNYSLDSACYYIQCLNCLTPFEGALGNLNKIFEKCVETCNQNVNTESGTQVEHIQNTICNFLSLIDIWYFEKKDDKIPQRCNTIAQQLKIALEFKKAPTPDFNKNYSEYAQAILDENINPSYLNGNIIHKIVQICLFTLTKICENDEKKSFECKAFTLALFSQLLQKLLKQLEEIGFKNPSYKYQNSSALTKNFEEGKLSNTPNGGKQSQSIVNNGISNADNLKLTDITIDENNKKKSNGEILKNVKKLNTKCRRRRRIVSSDSSEISDIEQSDIDSYDTCSDEENVCIDSPFDSDEDSKSEDTGNDDLSKEISEKKMNGHQIHEVSDETTKENKDNIKQAENTKVLNESELKRFLLNDNILPSIKLLHDWILTEKELIQSCGNSGEAFFQCVVDLLNIFTHYFSTEYKENAISDRNEILDYVNTVAMKLKLEYKSIPLPEDINLRGTNICKFDKNAAEWLIFEKYSPSRYEENIIRILNFIDFGNQIAQIVPRIRFNRTMKIFYYKKLTKNKYNTKLSQKRNKERYNNTKKDNGEVKESGLLHRLGQLWLTSKVRELERNDRTPLPAFLTLDACALYKHLRRVKQLLHTRNFVLLIPAIVLQELDDLKREKSSARDAIRWLEIQLRSGSRFLKAQKPGQSKPLPLLKYPRKAPAHIHNFIQILEFCNHFITEDKQYQGGNGDPDNSICGKSTPLLVLLVGDESRDYDQYKEFSMSGAAEATGISVEHIEHFYTKLRQKNNKVGKKR